MIALELVIQSSIDFRVCTSSVRSTIDSCVYVRADVHKDYSIYLPIFRDEIMLL